MITRFLIILFLFLNQNICAIDFSGFKNSVSSVFTLPTIVGASIAVAFTYSLVKNPEIVARCAEPVAKTAVNVVASGIQTVVAHPIATAFFCGYSGYINNKNRLLRNQNKRSEKELAGLQFAASLHVNNQNELETKARQEARQEGRQEGRQDTLSCIANLQQFEVGAAYFMRVSAEEYRRQLRGNDSGAVRVSSAVSANVAVTTRTRTATHSVLPSFLRW